MRLDCFYRAECGGYMHPAYCTPYLGTFSLRVGHHQSWVLNSLMGLCNASEGLFLTQNCKECIPFIDGFLQGLKGPFSYHPAYPFLDTVAVSMTLYALEV